MSSYNPTAALSAINPSLIGYMGGYGKAMQSIGGSLTQVGQAKLDLEQKDVDNKKNQAYLDLQRQNTQLGLDNASYVKKKDFETRNDKFTSNANTNALILGEDAPVEMSNRYAQLSNIDPAVMTAMAKVDKDKYAATDGGLIYNTGTGQMVNDFRNSGTDAYKGTKSIQSIVNGKLVETVFGAGGKPMFNLTAPGTPTGVYGMQVSDAIGDTNVGQRPVIKNGTDQSISAGKAIQDGGLPVRLSDDPRVARAQKDYLYPTAGGGWFVPAGLVGKYKKQFPQ